jgi:hypothetical protein
MAYFIYLVFICTFILLLPTVKMLDPAFVKIEENNGNIEYRLML